MRLRRKLANGGAGDFLGITGFFKDRPEAEHVLCSDVERAPYGSGTEQEIDLPLLGGYTFGCYLVESRSDTLHGFGKGDAFAGSGVKGIDDLGQFGDDLVRTALEAIAERDDDLVRYAGKIGELRYAVDAHTAADHGQLHAILDGGAGVQAGQAGGEAVGIRYGERGNLADVGEGLGYILERPPYFTESIGY